MLYFFNKIFSLCYPHEIQYQIVRYGLQRFKRKIAKVRPLRTPTALALDHFDFYYGPLFGDKWPSIRLALLMPHKYIAILNKFSRFVHEEILKEYGAFDLLSTIIDQTSFDKDKKRKESDLNEHLLGDCEDLTIAESQSVNLPKQEDFIIYPRELKLFSFPRGSTNDFPAPSKDRNRIPGWWLVTGSSIIPVLALNLCKGDVVLDMCAIRYFYFHFSYFLSRLGDLKRSLSIYIPVNSDESKAVFLKRKDASDLTNWDEFGLYDKVLADVTCTTDRHSLQQDELNIFATAKTNERLTLPFLQTKILINALRSVRVGGCVVYSTCTLSSVQNEGVIENAVAIASEQFGIEAVEMIMDNMQKSLSSTGLFEFYPGCRRGLLILPFLPSNFGPLYVCKLRRTK
ncbi:unnamed protein product [Dracunculus medinensis]|uniref:NOL1/NOP2/Sun domain family member 4 n=1 Tax=Dracunculus medinensis TaxID=318479 RepID=A0A3P7PLP0_DRAME|nr:unnamed protein product [Dracunculus medinensis]